jgi:hypothetical protein
MGWTAGVRFSAGAKELSLLHSIQTGSGAHPASYPMGTGGFFPGLKQPGCEYHHAPPCSADVMNGGAIPPLPHISSWKSV